MPSSAEAQNLIVGGFNNARGGAESLANASEAGLKQAIKTAFPHTKFQFAKKLTKTFLGSVNVVVLGAAFASTTPIASLSASEQKNLLHFVKTGGTVLIFADNDAQFQGSSNSLLAPFGLSATGFLNGDNTATFLEVSPDPIQNGPFGTVAQLDTSYPGWFDQLGTSTELAQLGANGQPALAYYPRGALGSGSGAAVFFSDSSLMIDGGRTPNDQTAILNALALAQPPAAAAAAPQ